MTGCCTLGAGRNFTACEFFPRKFAEVGGHVRCTNRSKHASDAEFLTLAAAAQLLVENSVGSGGTVKNQTIRICCGLMSSYTRPRQRILRVSKEFTKFAR